MTHHVDDLRGVVPRDRPPAKDVELPKYKLRKMTGPKADKMRALMKYTRAKAVVDTLRWTIGVRGQSSPLDEPLKT